MPGSIIPYLSAAFWVLFGSFILARLGIISESAFSAVYVKGGLILYCLKVGADTNVLIERAKLGNYDVVNAACNVMLNFLHLFIRVITILGDIKKREKRRQE